MDMPPPSTPPTDGQLFCHAMLGKDAGDEVIALVERSIDGPCPCKRGLICPLAPQPKVAATGAA